MRFYGLLEEQEREDFLLEARRVAKELVIADVAGSFSGMQVRWVRGGRSFEIFRKHWRVEELEKEVGGHTIYDGRYFLAVRANSI
jgi:hypothetical protein